MASPQVSQLQTRVLLISDESPLSLGVEAVLRDRLVLEVICDVDRASIRERIRTFQPDAVVLGAACKADEPAPEWLRIMSDGLGIRLLTLSLHDNGVRIYDRGKGRTVTDVAGLLEACRSPQG